MVRCTNSARGRGFRMQWSGWQRELTVLVVTKRLGPSGASNGQLYRYGTQRYIHLYFKVELGSLCLGNKNINRYKFFSHWHFFSFWYLWLYVNHLHFLPAAWGFSCSGLRCWNFTFYLQQYEAQFPNVVVPNHMELCWTFISGCISFNCVDVMFWMKWHLPEIFHFFPPRSKPNFIALKQWSYKSLIQR